MSHTTDVEIALLQGGMTSGKPSVMFRLNMKDGSVVLGETSWAALWSAVRAAQARYGEP